LLPLQTAAAQPIVDGLPFGGLRHRLDDDELRAFFVAPVQLRLNGPRERLRVVRDHIDSVNTFAGTNAPTADVKSSQQSRLVSLALSLGTRSQTDSL